MQEAQANLKQAAVDFLAAAESVAAKAAQADPLDQVDLTVPDLGDMEPAISTADLADLQQRLARVQLVPQAVMELVALARQAGAVLLDSAAGG
jgi:hypothetical protein